MDSNFENLMFSRMIKSSCSGKLPQYFLITPKLIPNLTYTEDVTICFIFNGPWVEITPQDLITENILKSHSRKKRLLNNDNDTERDIAKDKEYKMPSSKRSRISSLSI